MATTDDIRVKVLSDPRRLRALRALVRVYLETCGLSGDRLDGAVLAVDEACANAVRHAYGGRCDGIIELGLRRARGGVEVVVRDDGTPAPLDRVAHAALPSAPPETPTPGGLGVPLIHHGFDEVDFRVGPEQGNCVTMWIACSADAENEA